MVYKTFTENELIIISFLARHFSENYSINQLAKNTNVTPKGAHKILKRLEQNKIVLLEKIGNAVIYHLNFHNELAKKAVELSFFNDIKLPYARVQAKDFEALRDITQAGILFGSILEKGIQAGDIDILFILEEKKYAIFKKNLAKIKEIKTKNIHEIIETKDDFIRNLKKKDPVTLDIIQKGHILWGIEVIVNCIKEAK